MRCGRLRIRRVAREEMSFHCERVIITAAVRLPEDDKQRDHGECRDHQQLVIINIGNDLRLLRDHGVECGATEVRDGDEGRCAHHRPPRDGADPF